MRNVLLGMLVLLVAAPLGAATTKNDDSCDIGLYPAATLLLPAFEVELSPSSDGNRTIFAVTNTGARPQAARVTLWTDHGFPVVSFNLFLTGYDVQKVDLHDVIARGIIAPEGEMGSPASPAGDLSDADNPRLDEETCAQIPRVLPTVYAERVQLAFTTGRLSGRSESFDCPAVGDVHTRATGYATVDVVGACTSSMPIDESYFSHEIRFDNVLIGDYTQVHGAADFAQGNPMVHIRAIPEGGQMSTRRKTNLPDTFYGRLQPQASRTGDARQPLPSTFAVRWIEGGSTGFETHLKIWRESAAPADAGCGTYDLNERITYEVVRFDEAENAEALAPDINRIPVWPAFFLPPVSITSTRDSHFPPDTTGASAGWMYLNLHGNRAVAGAAVKTLARQGWVTASMRAENRFSVDIDAVALGNGCSPAAPASRAAWGDGTGVIGPAPDVTP